MRKFVSDAIVVFEIEALRTKEWIGFYVISIVVAPIGLLLFAMALVPEGFDDVETRLIAGSLVFGIGIMTVNNLAQMVLVERFRSMLVLVITSPVHRLSYALGVVVFFVAQGLVTAGVILGFAPLLHIHIELSAWLLPILALTALSTTGLGIVVATWAPTNEVGNVLANLFGIFLTLFSPVYYPMERLPGWLQWVARFSPYTHGGQAVDALLSGSGGWVDEALILAVLTVAGLAFGVAGLRWRER